MIERTAPPPETSHVAELPPSQESDFSPSALECLVNESPQLSKVANQIDLSESSLQAVVVEHLTAQYLHTSGESLTQGLRGALNFQNLTRTEVFSNDPADQTKNLPPIPKKHLKAVQRLVDNIDTEYQKSKTIFTELDASLAGSQQNGVRGIVEELLPKLVEEFTQPKNPEAILNAAAKYLHVSVQLRPTGDYGDNNFASLQFRTDGSPVILVDEDVMNSAETLCKELMHEYIALQLIQLVEEKWKNRGGHNKLSRYIRTIFNPLPRGYRDHVLERQKNGEDKLTARKKAWLPQSAQAIRFADDQVGVLLSIATTSEQDQR